MNSAMPQTLIHLVSDQTMQNLLPLLALRPAKVVQVRSRPKKFADSAQHLEQAVTAMAGTLLYADLRPEFIPEVIDEESPSPDTTRNVMARVLARHPGAVVNVTGGTKLMSLGALQATQTSAGSTAVYCDTQARRFNWLHGEPEAVLPEFEQLAASLTLDGVLAAHGVSPDKLRSVKPTADQLAFARGVHQLRLESGEEVGRFARRLRDQSHPASKDISKSAVDGMLAAGLPGPDNDTEHQYLALAAVAGLLSERDGKWFYRLAGNTLRPEDRVRAALEINKALLGGWFELYVYDRMAASGRFADLRTEVQSRDRSQQSIGETDIMGIDLRQLGLVFVSCKVSDEFLSKPLEHVFATRHRALEFGGTFAQTVFCIREFRDPNKRQIFGDACRVVRARLIEGEPDFSGS